jgi:hypothetical protein
MLINVYKILKVCTYINKTYRSTQYHRGTLSNLKKEGHSSEAATSSSVG